MFKVYARQRSRVTVTFSTDTPADEILKMAERDGFIQVYNPETITIVETRRTKMIDFETAEMKRELAETVSEVLAPLRNWTKP
jgi:hypothetical protein